MSSIIGVADADYINAFFAANTTYSQTQMDSLANTALSSGIDYYQKGSYDLAITQFKRSASLSSFSDNAAKAYDYIGKSYVKLGKTDQAIKTYEEAIRIYPVHDDFHLALGDIYNNQSNTCAALIEYKAAVRLDPTSTDNRYSLGQSYLTAGQYSDAREQFQQVVNRAPTSATGYYGLAQVERAAGNYQAAISQLDKAINADKTFINSYLELGKTYADMGDMTQANEQVSYLTAKGTTAATTAATTLSTYITQVTQPTITSASSKNGFSTSLGAATSVATLDTKLATPNSTKLFSMSFVFSKDMDTASVLNRYNWSISRASITQNNGVYNGGLTVPTTEATILPIPLSIAYDDTTKTATVQFRISQNAKGDATIDPKHIVFKFSGIDTYAKAMDTSADEYSGFSGIV